MLILPTYKGLINIIQTITPKQKGLNTQLHCISYFSDCGFLVSTPYGDNGRYDLIVDVNGNLIRVQVKTASLWYNSEGEPSGIKFSCQSSRINTKESYVRRYTKEEIDYFATYWNNQVYVVPVDETSNEKIIHFFESKNNQNNRISFLEDYTIQKQWFNFLKDDFSEEEILNLEPEKNNVKIIFNKKDASKTTKEYKCIRCGIPITKYSSTSYCLKCNAFLKRKTIRPDRETLKKLIRTMPFTTIGKEYNVSDNAIKKWCKTENLPYKKSEINLISDEDWIKI